MKFRKAVIEDLEWVDENSTHKRLYEAVDYVYALEDDKGLIGVGGFRMITPVTCWCWVEMGPRAKENVLTVYRSIRDWISGFSKEMGVKRLQAHIRPGFPEGTRLVEHLGFTFDDTMKDFYEDSDGLLYVRYI